jgi:hypothetical protein
MNTERCTICGSQELYRSRNALHNPLLLDIGELFEVTCTLCVACRHVEFWVSERSTAVFGKGKPLRDMIGKSERWQPVQSER